MSKNYLNRAWPICLVAILLPAPALFIGLQLDDYFHWALISQKSGVLALTSPGSFFGLFSFLDGDPKRVFQLANLGLVPWWTFPEIKYTFWRPVTELTHWVDYQFWPELPWLMHLHSMVYFGILVLISVRLFREFAPKSVAWVWGGWALALSFINGVPVGWLANRNAVVAVLFLVLSISYHHQWRTRFNYSALVFACISFMLGLLSGEMAVCTGAYLLAYALCIDGGNWQDKFRSIAPYLIIGGLWLLIRKALGYGAIGSGHYLDPIAEPGLFLQSFVVRYFDLLSGLLLVVPPELGAGLPSYRVVVYVVLTMAFFALIWPVLKVDKYARFWFFSALLSLIPVAATLPHSRLLFAANIGASAGLGILFALRKHADSLVEGTKRGFLLGGIYVLMVLHLVISPILLPLEAYSMKWFGDQLVNRFALSASLDKGNLEDEILIIINPPLSSAAGYINGVRSYHDRVLPEKTWVLASGIEPVVLRVLDKNTLEIESKTGLFKIEQEGVLRSPQKPFKESDTVELTGMTVKVTSVKDGIPIKANYVFDDNVFTSPRYRFVLWGGGEAMRCKLPPIGQTIELSLQSKRCFQDQGY